MSLRKKIAIVILPFLIPLVCTIAGLLTVHFDAQNGAPIPVLGLIFMLLPSWGIYTGGMFNIKDLEKDFDNYSLWVIILIPFFSHIAIGFYIISLLIIGLGNIADMWNS